MGTLSALDYHHSVPLPLFPRLGSRAPSNRTTTPHPHQPTCCRRLHCHSTVSILLRGEHLTLHCMSTQGIVKVTFHSPCAGAHPPARHQHGRGAAVPGAWPPARRAHRPQGTSPCHPAGLLQFIHGIVLHQWGFRLKNLGASLGMFAEVLMMADLLLTHAGWHFFWTNMLYTCCPSSGYVA